MDVVANGAGNTPPLVTIVAPGDNDSFTEDETIAFTASAIDGEEGDLTSSLVWTSSLDGAFGNGGAINTSDLRVGSHTITASATDLGGAGLTGSSSIAIEVTGTGGGTTMTLNTTGDATTRSSKANSNYGDDTFMRVK